MSRLIRPAMPRNINMHKSNIILDDLAKSSIVSQVCNYKIGPINRVYDCVRKNTQTSFNLLTWWLKRKTWL